MKSEKTKRPTRVGLISLGCAKNLVDAEIMLGSLLKSGVEIVNDPAGADAVIVNTCSFIDSAQEESVDAILESAQVRDAANRGQGLIVSGCLSQRFRDELPKLFPEVDAFMGIDQVERVGEIVQAAIARRAGKESSKFQVPSSKEAPTGNFQAVGHLKCVGENQLILKEPATLPEALRPWGTWNLELGTSFAVHASEDEMQFPGFAIQLPRVLG
jgi:tRNA A37 methylthiotransferase MiaB